jgi:hypothetical protein
MMVLLNMNELTLDDAIEAFRDNPSEDNKLNLRCVAQQYGDDEMISEAEVTHWMLEAWPND